MKILFQLFASFFKVGLFTFGGGLSMLPMLEREMINRRGWCTKEEILDYYAVGQCTPGIIAVDVAVFIGRCRHRIGALVAPMAVMLPGMLLVLVLAALLGQVAEYPAVQSAMVGIRIAVCALITASVVNILRESIKRWWQLGLSIAAFVIVAVFGGNPAFVVLGAVFIALFGLLRKKKAVDDAIPKTNQEPKTNSDVD